MLCIQNHIFVRRLLSDRLSPRYQCLNLASCCLDWVYGWVDWILQQKVFLVSLSLMITYKQWWHNSSSVRLCIQLSINWLPELPSCGCPKYWGNCWGHLLVYNPGFFIIVQCRRHNWVISNWIKLLLLDWGQIISCPWNPWTCKSSCFWVFSQHVSIKVLSPL